MREKKFVWSFIFLSAISWCTSRDVPEAFNYWYDYDYEDCQDGMCMDQEMFVSVQEEKQLTGSNLMVEQGSHWLDLKMRSVWETCLPSAPANTKAKRFEDCENVTVSEYDNENLELSCNFHKRGLISSTGEIDKANIEANYGLLTTASDMIKECVDWPLDADSTEVDQEYYMYYMTYVINGEYNYNYYGYYDEYYDDYDYDRSNKKGLKKKSGKKSKTAGKPDSSKVDEMLNGARNKVNRQRSSKEEKVRGRKGKGKRRGEKKSMRGSKHGPKGRNNKGKRGYKKGKKGDKVKKRKNKSKKNKKSKQGKNKRGNKRGKDKKGKDSKKGKNKDKKKEKQKAKEQKKKLTKSLEKIGLTVQPSKQTLLKAYCVHLAVERGLEKCATDTIKTVGLPEEFKDYYG